MGSKPIGISASRAAAILGLSKWKTPVEVWLEIMESRQPGFCEKNNYELPEFVDNASTRWGLAFEDAIIKLAEELSDDKIEAREMLFKADFEKLGDIIGLNICNNGIITCHVDGIYESANCLHEGKTTTIHSFRDEWGEPGTDKIPREYQIQVQHQMMLTGMTECMPSVLVFPNRPEQWEEIGWRLNHEESFGGMDMVLLDKEDKFKQRVCSISWARQFQQMGYFHQYKVKADPVLHKLLIEAYYDWWNEYVLGEKQPPIKHYDDIKKLVKEPKGTIIATEEMERLACEYKEINQEISLVKKRKEEIKTILLECMNAMVEVPIDEDSVEKWILRDNAGKKLCQYNGKVFR